MKMLISSMKALCLTLTLCVCSAVVSFGQADTPSPTTEDATYVKGMTPARARALLGVAFGIASIVVAWRARVKKSGNPRTLRITALILAAVAITLSVVHLVVTTGGFGTGGGKAGAIGGLVFGVLGAVLSARPQKSQIANR